MSELQKSGILAIHDLSKLLLAASPDVARLVKERDDLWETAGAHHVLVRAGSAMRRTLQTMPEGLETRLEEENARVAVAIGWLHSITRELAASGIRVAVIKSLDHFPDFGSDIDLLTDSPEGAVSGLMRSRFDGKIVSPTLGDRLAHKVNYRIPGLRELVEFHFGRLGQTGEHAKLAQGILDRRRMEDFQGSSLPVPAPEDRLIVATLQRMYRHFHLRICDIVNTARITESPREPGPEAAPVDFEELRHAAEAAGIWTGVATYLKLVSQYVTHYRGSSLRLPYSVLSAARFGLRKVYPHGGFLRLPLFPQAASLYTLQFANSVGRDPTASLRLTLLPLLAAVAGTRYRVTGSDKGIW